MQCTPPCQFTLTFSLGDPRSLFSYPDQVMELWQTAIWEARLKAPDTWVNKIEDYRYHHKQTSPSASGIYWASENYFERLQTAEVLIGI